MTTADTATARPSAWQRFRMWRRGRPFWGGLVAMLAGLEIYASSQQSIGGMEIKIGPGGMASYVIPLMLVVGGILAWITPAQRHFYGIVIPAVSVYALLEINFGGWFIGTLLGMIGGALIFAWTQDKVEAADTPEGEPELDDGEYAADTAHAPRHAAFDELLGPSEQTAIPRQGAPDGDRDIPTREKDGGSGRMLAIAIVPLLLVVAGFAAVRGSEAAYAAPCPAPTTKTAVRPARTASNATANKVTTPASSKAGVVASPRQAPAAAQAQTEAGPSQSPTAGLLGKIVNAVANLVDPSASPSDPPAESPAPSVSPGTPKPEPSKSSAPQPSGKPTAKPTTKPAPKPTGKPSTDCPSASPSPAKRLKAAAGQVDVGAKPSRMTGSKVTMTNLVFVGIVDLPTADGPITVLKFTMDQAVTDDFELLTYARGNHTSDVVFETKQLTVDQNVAFYTSRFQGNLLGAIPVDYTPANPPIIPPPGIPVPSVFFTDPDIQLVWVNADVLTGTPSLTSTLA